MSSNPAPKGGPALETLAAKPGSMKASSLGADLEHLPPLLTVSELAGLLRTTPKAVYSMHERRQLPGAVNVRRRLLFSRTELVRWLEQNRVPSLEGHQR